MSTLNKNVQNKLHSYFTQTLGARDYRNGWLKCDCPHCGKADKFGINLGHNMTNCFVCGEKMKPLSLIMFLENFNEYSEVTNLLTTGDYYDKEYVVQTTTLKSKANVSLPEYFVLYGNHDSSYVGKAAKRYLKKRGFTIEQARKLGWGYCNDGPCLGYLIMPFTIDNELIYYNARRFLGSGPRYNNPTNTIDEIGKSYIIYNYDALFLFKKVFLCEGAINAATMGEKGISSGGKDISAYQINLIIKSPVEEVIILFDSENFAKLKAVDTALKLIGSKRVKVVFVPPGVDVNDIGQKKALVLARETGYVDYNSLLKLKKILHNEKNTVHTY